MMLGTSCAPAFLSTKDDSPFINGIDKAIQTGPRSYESAVKLADSDKGYLLRTARSVLENHFSKKQKPLSIDDFKDVPPNVSSQSLMLFVTLVVNGQVRGCQGAKAGNLLENTIRAIQRAMGDSRFSGPLKEEELDATRIIITLLLDPIEVKGRTVKEIEKEIEVGIHSFSLEKDRKRTFFKSSVPVSHGYSLKYALKRLGKKAGLGEEAYQDPMVKIYKYDTIEFAERPTDKSLINIYRYNRLLHQSGVSKEACVDALRICGDYISNHISENGFITYDYGPYRDKKENPVSSPTVVRSLAGIWALTSVGSYFNDNKYKEAAKRSIDYFLNRYYVYDEKQDFGYLEISDQANLATAAFVLLALLEINEDDYHADKKQKLINFMLAMEDKEKGFLYPVYLPDKVKQFERKEVYYPGEALTAIMALYERTNDPKYLAVAQRVFDYYKELFKRSSRKASMAPWMSKAYTKVFLATGDKKYADFVLEMTNYVLSYQNGPDQKYADMIGSFYTKGSSSAAGVFLEGIAEGYKVAKAVDDKKRIEAYRKSMLMGLRFILQCQYTPDNMFTVENRNLTLGGVRTTIYTTSIRIDCVQHSVFAFLKALDYIYKEDYEE